MSTWPSSLPKELEKSGYEDEFPEQLLRSPIDELDSNTRRMDRLESLAPLKGHMYITSSQWRTLLNWFKDDLGSGAISFSFPKPGDISNNIKVAFVEPPKLVTVGGDIHTISLNMERR